MRYEVHVPVSRFLEDVHGECAADAARDAGNRCLQHCQLLPIKAEAQRGNA